MEITEIKMVKMFLKKNHNNKNSKGLQLNTHMRRIHFGDIYNHAVRKERKR